MAVFCYQKETHKEPLTAALPAEAVCRLVAPSIESWNTHIIELKHWFSTLKDLNLSKTILELA